MFSNLFFVTILFLKNNLFSSLFKLTYFSYHASLNKNCLIGKQSKNSLEYITVGKEEPKFIFFDHFIFRSRFLFKFFFCIFFSSLFISINLIFASLKKAGYFDILFSCMNYR